MVFTGAIVAMTPGSAVAHAGQLCSSTQHSGSGSDGGEVVAAHGADAWGLAAYRLLESTSTDSHTRVEVQLLAGDGNVLGCARRTTVLDRSGRESRAKERTIQSEDFALEWSGQTLLIRTFPAAGTFHVQLNGEWIGTATVTSQKRDVRASLLALTKDPHSLLNLANAVQADLAKSLSIRRR